MTINISSGTYNESVMTPAVVGPTTIFKGAGTGLTFVNNTGGSAGPHAFYAQSSNQITVQNMHVQATNSPVSGSSCFVAATGSTIKTTGTATGSAPSGYIFDGLNGYMLVGTNTFDAGTTALAVFVAFTGGTLLLISGSTYTLAGTVTIQSGAGPWATAIGGANLGVPTPSSGGVTPVFVNAGNAVCSKYQCGLNGVINTLGSGVNYFPGNTAGTLVTGGQYG
jgi:hypothetical protein